MIIVIMPCICVMFPLSISVLGEEVQGIVPRNADKADVNSAHVNPSGTAVATGDDYGCVKLFDGFPVSEPYVSTRDMICNYGMDN